MCGKGIKNKTHSTLRNSGVFSSCFHFSFKSFSQYIWASCKNKDKVKFRKRCVLSWITGTVPMHVAKAYGKVDI